MVKTFWLVLGYVCNNKCKGCYAAPSGFNGPWMNPTYAVKVMEEMASIGAKNCLLIGGEPSLYKELELIVKAGNRLGLRMILVTNGRVLSDGDRARSLFGAGLERAVISLEGHDAETHNASTGVECSFDETCRGIENCSSCGGVNTLTTISAANAGRVIETIALSYRLGSGKAVLNCSIPVPSQDGSTEHSMSLNPLEIAQVADKVVVEAVERSLEFQLNATFPLCLMDQQVLKGALERDWLSVGCHMYRGHGVAFGPEGEMLPCTHFTEMPIATGMMGADGEFLLSGGFEEFWRSEDGEPGMLRSELWSYPAERCEGCDYWGGCIGGCPMLWSHFDPQDFILRERG